MIVPSWPATSQSLGALAGSFLVPRLGKGIGSARLLAATFGLAGWSP